MAKRGNRLAWGLAAALAAVVAAGDGGLVLPWVRATAIARQHGPRADLRKAMLLYAPLAEVDLTGVDLTGADLRSTFLIDANLEGASLRGANLARAMFSPPFPYHPRTCLKSADLRGADLRGRGLGDANLEGARYDARTRLPLGFDPRRHGAIQVP